MPKYVILLYSRCLEIPKKKFGQKIQFPYESLYLRFTLVVSLMNKLYSISLTYRFLFILSLFFLSNFATAQISNDDAFNSTDRGHGFGDGPNGFVRDIKVQPDGKVLIIGDFTKYNGAVRSGIARLKGNSQGMDSSFVTGSGFAGGFPKKMELQPDGKIVVIGTFSSYNGTTANGMVRINPNGFIDNTFNIGNGTLPTVGAITAIKKLSNGKFMVAGLFTNINSTARAGLVRLNPNGTVDPSFSPNIQSASFFSSTFGDIDVQSDGKVLLGGVFLNNFFLGANISFPLGALVVRFGANGGIDPAFTKVESFGGGLGVLSLYVTTGDKFVIGGQFSLNTSNGLNHNVARINSDGTPDVSFF